jgi:hypothetical protein
LVVVKVFATLNANLEAKDKDGRRILLEVAACKLSKSWPPEVLT